MRVSDSRFGLPWVVGLRLWRCTRATQGKGRDAGSVGATVARDRAAPRRRPCHTDHARAPGLGGAGPIHIEIGGPLPRRVDIPSSRSPCRFGGEAGTALNFTTGEGGGIAAINEVNGIVVVSWVTEELGANAQDCQLSNWTIGATSGSGSFDCSNGFATKVDGSFLSGITMRGTFQASL